VIAALVAALPSGPSFACGACDEDKIAATYDHAVIGAAIARHGQIVFVAIDGPVDAGRIGTRLAAAASKMPGVVSASLRTSLSPPAFSFALDGAQEAESTVARFRKAVAEPGLRLTLVRVMRDGTLVGPK
jgi:hypothetical protein